jgi:hypothetical protein
MWGISETQQVIETNLCSLHNLGAMSLHQVCKLVLKYLQEDGKAVQKSHPYVRYVTAQKK